MKNIGRKEESERVMNKMKTRCQVLYNYRYLIKQLVTKDIKLKYRRSFLGYVWSVLNPLMVMVVMYLVFSKMFIGQTLFTFMTEATNQAIFSITGNGPLLKKVYVPKYVFTLSKVTSSLVNLVFSLGAMIIVFVITKVQFSWAMLFFPVILMEVYIFSLGLGLLLAELTVFFRDIQYIYNVLTTAWMYLTPIFYPMEQLPESVQKAIKIFNPMYQYITQFRTISLHQTLPAAGDVVYGFAIAFVFLIVGSWAFIRKQDDFILYI